MISYSYWGWWGVHDRIQTFRGFFSAWRRSSYILYMYLCTCWLNCSWISCGQEHTEAKCSVSNYFYARLPHQQPFTEQKDPLSHPAGVSDTWKARGSVVTHGIHHISGVCLRSHEQNISRDWTNAPAFARLICRPIKPIFFNTTCREGRGSTSIYPLHGWADKRYQTDSTAPNGCTKAVYMIFWKQYTFGEGGVCFQGAGI